MRNSVATGIGLIASLLSLAGVVWAAAQYYNAIEARLKYSEDQIARISEKIINVGGGSMGLTGPRGARGPKGEKGDSPDLGSLTRRVEELSAEIQRLTNQFTARKAEFASAFAPKFIQPSKRDFQGGCLDVAPGEAKKFTLLQKRKQSSEVCWRDGRVMARSFELSSSSVLINWTSGGWINCNYARGDCSHDFQNGATLNWSTEKLVGEAGVLIHLSFK